MRHSSLVLGLLFATFAMHRTMAIELDPCVTEQGKFKTTADALQGQTTAVAAKLASWNDNPDLIPDSVLQEYRVAVRNYAYGIWKDSAAGKGVLKSWQPLANDDVAKAKFMEFVYDAEIPPDLERKLAQAVYQKDYNEHLKPQLIKAATDLNKDIADNRAKLDEACSPTVFATFLRVTLGNAIIMVNGNFDAAKREDGEVAKAVRALTGISVTDIMKNGLQGGENSEVSKFNKMLDGVMEKNGLGRATVVGQIFNALNPTKWSATVPQIKVDTRIKIDSRSLSNTATNLTGGLVK